VDSRNEAFAQQHENVGRTDGQSDKGRACPFLRAKIYLTSLPERKAGNSCKLLFLRCAAW
jgi:hypothetical protein